MNYNFDSNYNYILNNYYNCDQILSYSLVNEIKPNINNRVPSLPSVPTLPPFSSLMSPKDMPSTSNHEYRAPLRVTDRADNLGHNSGWDYNRVNDNSYYGPPIGHNHQNQYFNANVKHTNQSWASVPNPNPNANAGHNHWPPNENIILSNVDYEDIAATTGGCDQTWIPTPVRDVENQMKRENDCSDELSQSLDESNSDADSEDQLVDNEYITQKNTNTRRHNRSSSSQSLCDSVAKLRKTRRKRKRKLTFEEMKLEKRENNRLAAMRCRLKKLDHLSQLKTSHDQLVTENRFLEHTVVRLRDQVVDKQMEMAFHYMGGCLFH